MIALADNTKLDGPARPGPLASMLADSLDIGRVLPADARGGLFAYGEADQLGHVGAKLALYVRGPEGITFMGEVAHTYDKPLTARVMLAKVF